MLCKAIKLQLRDRPGKAVKERQKLGGIHSAGTERQDTGTTGGDEKMSRVVGRDRESKNIMESEEERAAGNKTSWPGLRWIEGFSSPGCKLTSPI